MEISYKREMNRNYMVAAPDWPGAEGYESRMLLSNSIAGTLKFRLKQTDNQPLFYYEITSKQPLKRVIEKRYIRPEEIRRLLVHIASVQTRLENYLMPESRILLDPEYIYVDLDTFAFSLCVVPAYEGNFPEAFTKLLQYIMEKVDHQDKDSVVMAYRLYHESLRENCGIQQILKALGGLGETLESEGKGASLENETGADAGERHGRYEEEVRMPEPSAKEKISGGKYDDWEWEQEIPDKETDLRERLGEPAGKSKKKQKSDIRKRKEWKKRILYGLLFVIVPPVIIWLLYGENGLRRFWWVLAAADSSMFIAGAAMWITGRKMKNHVEKSGQDEEKRREKAKKNTAQKTQIPESWKIMFDEEERDPKEYATEREKAAAEGPEAVRLQPAAVAAPPPDAAIKTEVLADFSDSDDMACLVPEDGGQRIVIEYVPFIIGKSADMADACLERKTVSRLHARIDRKEGVFILTDLNSTNGTTVEGYKLEANETVSLKDGDRVMLADAVFQFMEKRW